MKTQDDTSSLSQTWIPLTRSKDWSRLLYPNPVCFLCTNVPSTTSDGTTYTPNVMTLSWLTATNNEGRFLFSINQRRHSAQAFLKDIRHKDFCLCVPTAAQIPLVLAVGKRSGRQRSKFLSESQESQGMGSLMPPTTERMSKKQRKMWEDEQWSKGIPGLKKISFYERETSDVHKDLFCIEGTVARLHCQILQVVDPQQNQQQDTTSLSTQLVDEDHLLVSAQVVHAYCRADYWDADKHIFRCPRAIASCDQGRDNTANDGEILTFLGSQTFGHIQS